MNISVIVKRIPPTIDITYIFIRTRSHKDVGHVGRSSSSSEGSIKMVAMFLLVNAPKHTGHLHRFSLCKYINALHPEHLRSGAGFLGGSFLGRTSRIAPIRYFMISISMPTLHLT